MATPPSARSPPIPSGRWGGGVSKRWAPANERGISCQAGHRGGATAKGAGLIDNPAPFGSQPSNPEWKVGRGRVQTVGAGE